MSKLNKIFEKFEAVKRLPLQIIYCVMGEEEYLRDSAIKQIVEKAKFSGESESTLLRFFGDELDHDDLDVQLTSYSLFSESKTIIIKNTAKMRSTCWEIIEKFVKNPTENTTLVLDDDKFDKRNAAVNSVCKTAYILEFPALYDDQLLEWLHLHAKRLQLELTEEAAVALRESCEPKMRHLMNELDKIKLFSGDKTKLSADDIIDIVQTNRGFNIFDFTHALFGRDNSKKLEHLQKIFLFSESAPGIIVMIARHVTILLKIKLYSSMGLDRGNMEKVIGLRRWFLNQYFEQAKRLTIDSLKLLLDIVLEADTNLKTGRFNEKMVLTLLVLRIQVLLEN